MAAFGLSVTVDVREQCEALAARFEQFGSDALPRAAQFSVNGVASDAVRQFRERLPAALGRPTQTTLDAGHVHP